MRKAKQLRVVANPFCHFDHEGRPAAAVPFDPDWHSPDRRHVGAKHAAEVIEARAPAEISYGPDGKARIAGDDRPPVHDIWFEFDVEPQTVPDTPHYRAMMKPSVDGGPALLPANAETARAISARFREPREVLVETAKAMVARWALDHEGEVPDWAHVHPELLPEGAVATLQASELHRSHLGHARLYAVCAGKPDPLAPPAPPASPAVASPAPAAPPAAPAPPAPAAKVSSPAPALVKAKE
jgi:hypothetical protein